MHMLGPVKAHVLCSMHMFEKVEIWQGIPNATCWGCLKSPTLGGIHMLHQALATPYNFLKSGFAERLFS